MEENSPPPPTAPRIGPGESSPLSVSASVVNDSNTSSPATKDKTFTKSKQLFDITESFTMPAIANDICEISNILHPLAEPDAPETGDKLSGWSMNSFVAGPSGDMDIYKQFGRTILSTANNSGHLDPIDSEPQLRPKTSSPVVPMKKLKTDPYYEDSFQPGTYKVHLELEQLWIKTKQPLTTDFSLALHYPPLGIPKSCPVICLAKKDPLIPYISGDPGRKCALIYSGKWDIVEKIEELSGDLLHTPIVVEVRLVRSEDTRSAPFATVEIPFGEIFSVPLKNDRRTLRNSAPLRRLEDSQKLGCLNYFIELNEVCTLNESNIMQDKDKDAMDGLKKFNKSLKLHHMDHPPHKSTIVVEDKTNESEWIEWKIREMNRFQKELKDKEFQHLKGIQKVWEEKNAISDRKHKNLVQDYKSKTELLLEKTEELDGRYNYLLERQDGLNVILDESQLECSGKIQDLESQLLKLKQSFDSEVIDLKNEITILQTERQMLKNKYLTLQAKLKSVDYKLESLEPNRTNYSIISKLETMEQDLNLLKHVMNQSLEEQRSTSEEIKKHPLMRQKLDSESGLSYPNKSGSTSGVSKREQQSSFGHNQSQFNEDHYESWNLDKVNTFRTDFDDAESEEEKVAICSHPILSFNTYNTRSQQTKAISENISGESSLLGAKLDITRLTTDYIESLDLIDLSNEIRALTTVRNHFVETLNKNYSYSDPFVRKLENALTHLASVYELKKAE